MLIVVLIAIIYTCADVTCVVIPPLSFTKPPAPPPSVDPNDGRIGKWGPWSRWSSCTKPCAGGLQERSRKCESGPDDCPGGMKASEESRACNVFQCCDKKPILHQWTKWNSCPVTCGEGIIFRVRRCQFFNCFEGPALCNATLQETKPCQAGCCPVEPKWTDWTDWSPCTCVGRKAEKTRTRECMIDDCEKSPKMCIGETEESKKCSKKCKAPKPEWSDWSNWSDCSVTCGNGKITRDRTCSETGSKKKKCKGKSVEEMECNAGCCEESFWGDWDDWSDCTATCDGGEQERTRECNKPCEDSGPCRGLGVQTRRCNEEPCCSGESFWGDWDDWTDCTATCDGGEQERTRECNKPCKDSGPCRGLGVQTRRCNEEPCCSGESFWGDWDDWSDCTVTCDGGEQERTRECNKPCEDSGPCKGMAKDTRRCNEQDCCTGESEWQDWKDWSECTEQCDGGSQMRTRECFKPCPDSGPCIEGSDTDTRTCNNQPCEKKCKGKSKWADWDEWSSCSATCGEGEQERTRICNKPCPDSKECKRGSSKETRSCNIQECCVGDSTWSDWNKWSGCDVTCGGGSQVRNRTCNQPCPDSGPCEGGSDSDSRPCNTNDCCTGESEWSDWKPWSDCTAPCGGGEQGRRRDCNKPCEDSEPCPGSDFESRKCNEQDCEEEDPCKSRKRPKSEWSDWKQWSDCTAPCGGGEQGRRRDCNKPCEDSEPCPGSDFESRKCNEQDCEEEDPCKTRKGRQSVWKDWGDWSPCSVSCGPGKSMRVRECNRPCPNSKPCKGPNDEEKKCKMINCDGTEVCEDDVWGPWVTSPCSVTCGDGRKTRTRKCIKTCPEGKPCNGDSEDFVYCNDACCPVASQWSEWSDWSECCERTEVRSRTCEAQQPCREREPKCMLDGELITENDVETRPCLRNKKCRG